MQLECPSCKKQLRKIAGVEGHFKCDEEGIIWKEMIKGDSGATARHLVRVSPPVPSRGLAEGPATGIEKEPMLEKTTRIERPPDRNKR